MDRRPKTNYRLKDGDLVVFTKPVSISSYWYDEFTGQSSWYAGHILPGTLGTVIRARTPSVRTEGVYFANVDITLDDGTTIRVRPFHNEIRKTKESQWKSTPHSRASSQPIPST